MVQRVSTVAFEGIEVRPVDVQVQVAPGMPAFTLLWIINLGYNAPYERPPTSLLIHSPVHRRSA